jgi:hypothetical protein
MGKPHLLTDPVALHHADWQLVIMAQDTEVSKETISSATEVRQLAGGNVSHFSTMSTQILGTIEAFIELLSFEFFPRTVVPNLWYAYPWGVRLNNIGNGGKHTHKKRLK